MPETIDNLEQWKPVITYAVSEMLLIMNTQQADSDNMRMAVLEQRIQELEDRMAGMNNKLAVRKAFLGR